VGTHSGKLHSGVIIPILPSLLPVSAPSDNDWALGVDSLGDFEFPTLIRDGTSGRRGSDQQALQR
jgi:hypothetical protein